MGNIDRKILNDIYKTTKIGIDSVNYIYSKVDDENLKSDLDEYKRKYNEIIDETEYRLELLKSKPEYDSFLLKNMVWPEAKIQTFLDRSSSNIAEVLIKGSTKGIVEMTKDVNNELADEDVRKIANTLIHYEKSNITNMKKYL